MDASETFRSFAAHCRERADYYRAWYLKTHNEDFLDIELSLRRLSSKAICSSQEAELPSPGSFEHRRLVEVALHPDQKEIPISADDCGCS